MPSSWRLRGAPVQTSPSLLSETSKSTTRSIAPRGSRSRSNTSEPSSRPARLGRRANALWRAARRRARPARSRPGRRRAAAARASARSRAARASAGSPRRGAARAGAGSAAGGSSAPRSAGAARPRRRPCAPRAAAATRRAAARPSLSSRSGFVSSWTACGARRVGGREQARQAAADAQLVRAEEAAVPEPEAERMLDAGRQAAVAQRDQEDVAVFDHDRVGQIGQLRRAGSPYESACPARPRVHIGGRERSPHEDRNAGPAMDRDPAARIRRDRAGGGAARRGADRARQRGHAVRGAGHALARRGAVPARGPAPR